MNGYVKKVSHTLILGIVIFLVCIIIYLAYPKYQIEMVRVDNETVMIIKLNKLTGQTNTYYEKTKLFTTEDIYEELGL